VNFFTATRTFTKLSRKTGQAPVIFAPENRIKNNFKTNDMNLQTEQQFFASSLKDYLDRSNAKGLWFKMGNISATTIRKYIQGGLLLDENREKRILHTECRIPEKKLYELLGKHIENPQKNIDEEVQKSKDYRWGIEALMKEYPQLKYAKFNISSNEIIDYLYAEGEPVDKAICYMLHYPNIDTNTLYHLLKDNKGLSTNALDEKLNASIVSLKKTMDLPDGVFVKYGAQCFYFYERGKMGYATVHPDRSVNWKGEPLSATARNLINKIASAGNYIYLNEPFFQSQATGRINMLVADSATGKFRDIYIQQYTDNQKNWDVIMENGVPFEGAIIDNLTMMKGRLTQVQFMEKADGHYVRCRIDGEQQMYQHVKPIDYAAYQKGAMDAEQLAARYFVGQFLSMQQERHQGMKR